MEKEKLIEYARENINSAVVDVRLGNALNGGRLYDIITDNFISVGTPKALWVYKDVIKTATLDYDSNNWIINNWNNYE